MHLLVLCGMLSAVQSVLSAFAIVSIEMTAAHFYWPDCPLNEGNASSSEAHYEKVMDVEVDLNTLVPWTFDSK